MADACDPDRFSAPFRYFCLLAFLLLNYEYTANSWYYPALGLGHYHKQ